MSLLKNDKNRPNAIRIRLSRNTEGKTHILGRISIGMR